MRIQTKCRLCGKDGATYDSKNFMYSCNGNIETCPSSKKFNEHISVCPICQMRAHRVPKESHYHIYEYKCFGLRAIMNKEKGNPLGHLPGKYKVQLGLSKCSVCGKKATHYLNEPLCGPSKRSCPKHSEHLSKLHKRLYRENPERKDRMSEVMFEVQNRRSVKEKKSEAMLILHHGDCDECKDFQKKFKEGHKKRRTEKYAKYKKYYETYKRRHENDE